MPALDAVATQDPELGTLTVFAVNRGAEALALDSSGLDLSRYRVVEHLTLTHLDLKAVNTLAQPDTVVPRANGDAALRDGALNAHLAGYSWNVIRLAQTTEA